MADEIIDLAPAGRPAPGRDDDLGAELWVGSGECPTGLAAKHLCFALAVIIGFIGFSVALKGVSPANRTTVMVLTGLTSVGFAVAGLLQPRRGTHIQIAAYDRGLMFHDAVDTHTVYWQEVATVSEERLDIQHDHGETQRFHNLVLTTRDGRTHAMDLGAIDDSERFTRLVHERTVPHIVPRVTGHLKVGRTVRFGPLTLHPEGLARDGAELAWADLAGVGVEKGALLIARRGDRRMWAEVPCAQVPNLHSLLYLINNRATMQDARLVAEPDKSRPGASRYSVLDRY